MTDLFQDLYEKLLKGIEDIEKNNPEPKKQIESCFHLCETVRREADNVLTASTFVSEAEEVAFFKIIKPRFTSLVEFYSILYRAELFIPENKADQIEFWRYELQRAQLFIDRNADFVEYLTAGDTSKDREYFLRRSSEEVVSPQDELIAKLLARQKYVDYINLKILPGLS